MLRNESEYYDRIQKLRFAVPEGWKTNAKSNLPVGSLNKERMLVEYQQLGPLAAVLRVTAVDLKDEEPAAYLDRTNRRKREFKPPTSEATQLGGLPATRFTFLHVAGGLDKEVVTVRRDERLYLFLSECGKTDAKAREAIRNALASVVWEK